MTLPILYSFRRCPYAMRARMALILSSTKCELREIILQNKPASMLQISPKGTVPVLQLEDQVIDESLDVIAWAMQTGSAKLYTYSEDEEAMSNNVIKLFDTKFKYHLDRYKYATRHGTVAEEHQYECLQILTELDQKIKLTPWIFGGAVSTLDISILPFIRQCRIANPDWFMAQKFKRVIDLLEYFECTDLFKLAMTKYDLWDPEKPVPIIFLSV